MKPRRFERMRGGVLGLIVLVTMFAQPHSMFGLSVRPRDESGAIQSVDFQARRLTINLGCGDKTLTVTWDSWTRFIDGLHFTTVDRLKRGMQIIVYYHSPFFGERYATKILFSNGPSKCPVRERILTSSSREGQGQHRCSGCEQRGFHCRVRHPTG